MRVLALLVGVFVLAAPLRAREVTDETGRRIQVPEHPERIISLAPSITETLYALGVEDRLVGDTNYCDFPPEAKLKPHVGNLLNPSLEKIVSLKPDLVLGDAESNRLQTADQLERLGIPLYGLRAHNVADTLKSIEDVGQILGSEAQAAALAAKLRARVQAVEQRVSGRPRPRVLFVVWYQPLITAGPDTFVADVIRLAGGESIANDLRGEWPHMSLEDVVARDPDIILFPRTEAFAPDLAEFRRLPGWKDLRAVKEGRLEFISDAINRPSPRLVDALEEVAAILHPEAFGTHKSAARLNRAGSGQQQSALNSSLTSGSVWP